MKSRTQPKRIPTTRFVVSIAVTGALESALSATASRLAKCWLRVEKFSGRLPVWGEAEEATFSATFRFRNFVLYSGERLRQGRIFSPSGMLGQLFADRSHLLQGLEAFVHAANRASFHFELCALIGSGSFGSWIHLQGQRLLLTFSVDGELDDIATRQSYGNRAAVRGCCDKSRKWEIRVSANRAPHGADPRQSGESQLGKKRKAIVGKFKSLGFGSRQSALNLVEEAHKRARKNGSNR
jgi:hypothetical protein